LNFSIRRSGTMINRAKILYLVLGIGIGIVIASIIYSLYPTTKYVELTDEMIIEKAKDLGMVSLKESLNLEDNKDNPEREDTTNSNESIEGIDIEGQNATENDIDAIEDLNSNEKANIDGNNEFEEEKEQVVRLEVEWKETLTDVANKLYELGLIDDVENFRSYAIKNGYSRVIRVGQFEIKQNSSYDEILKILTKKNKY